MQIHLENVRADPFLAPANEAVEWEVTEWHAGDGLHEPYVGVPRPELEDAWKGLLQSKSSLVAVRCKALIRLLLLSEDMNVRLSLEDIKAFDREENAIALPDGSGYLGTLNVYHEIHCIVSFFS